MSQLLYPQGNSPQYSLNGRAGLNMVVKRKNPSPHWEMNPRCPACSLVIILIELLRLL
jgi:hypothetical protein